MKFWWFIFPPQRCECISAVLQSDDNVIDSNLFSVVIFGRITSGTAIFHIWFRHMRLKFNLIPKCWFDYVSNSDKRHQTDDSKCIAQFLTLTNQGSPFNLTERFCFHSSDSQFWIILYMKEMLRVLMSFNTSVLYTDNIRRFQGFHVSKMRFHVNINSLIC